MKYTVEIEIEKPVDEVVKLFDSVENLYDWMEGLKKFEHLEGEAGEVGAKSRLTFQMGKREIVMIETITEKNLPKKFAGTYEAKGVWNSVSNSFEPVRENKTLYISEQEFKMGGFMKIFAFLMPGAFKKQSMKHLQAFKNYAESK